jgi:hypothetical protein
MPDLIETLASELERPRELSARVLNYIGGTYGIDHDAIGAFLTDELSKLEDYEIDLILSPVFTPRLSDQAIFAELLGGSSLVREQWPGLVERLAARPTRARLVTPDARQHLVALREVIIERYVYRLRLDGAVHPSVFELLEKIPQAADYPMLKSVARAAVWENTGCREILVRYLANAPGTENYSLQDAIELLNLVESRKPANLEELLTSIPRWQETMRQQLNIASAGKPFFSEHVEALHGGGRDQRQHDPRISSKENDLAFLDRLQSVLESETRR